MRRRYTAPVCEPLDLEYESAFLSASTGTVEMTQDQLSLEIEGWVFDEDMGEIVF